LVVGRVKDKDLAGLVSGLLWQVNRNTCTTYS
jgi:hypothetical protein